MADREPALPDGYSQLLTELKDRVRTAQRRAQRVVNTELIQLYWGIGHAILDRQERDGWGAKVIDRLAADLRHEFPGMRGFSRSNLEYMRRFAAAYRGNAFPQQAVGGLPWGHITLLLDRQSDPSTRDWYASEALEQGWSRSILLNQMKGSAHLRVGAAPSNFAGRLTADDSELAQQLSKDPYVFEFLGIRDRVAERDLEQALMERLQDTLLELGRGFTFAGRQVHFEVDGDDFYVDLLFFHTEQLRWVVVELKIGKFEPADAGQLGFYVALVDDHRRLPSHAPTVGLLLCASRNERVVRYALGSSANPMAVSTYSYGGLPTIEQQSLPADADVLSALERPLTVEGSEVTLADYLDGEDPVAPDDR